MQATRSDVLSSLSFSAVCLVCRGYAFHTPLLSPYEAEVALQQTVWASPYPMDYYAEQGGRWSNYHPDNKQTTHVASSRAGAGAGATKGVNPIRARKEARAAAAAAAAAAATTAAGTPADGAAAPAAPKAKVEIAYAAEEPAA
jgi:hypothetical protein